MCVRNEIFVGFPIYTYRVRETVRKAVRRTVREKYTYTQYESEGKKRKRKRERDRARERERERDPGTEIFTYIVFICRDTLLGRQAIDTGISLLLYVSII